MELPHRAEEVMTYPVIAIRFMLSGLPDDGRIGFGLDDVNTADGPVREEAI